MRMTPMMICVFMIGFLIVPSSKATVVEVTMERYDKASLNYYKG